MFSEIMVPLGVVIPLFNDGLLLLRSFLSKKYTLEMMEEFVDSEVLEALRQRIAMVKIERTAKVDELQGEALQRKEEQELTKAEAAAAAYEESRLDEAIHREEEKMKAEATVAKRKERKKEQEGQARQRKEDQEEQAPKARGKCKTFDDRIKDLIEYKQTHGHLNVKFNDDESLYQFCAQVRHSLKQPEKNGTIKLTEECISRLDAFSFKWRNA